MEDTNKKQSKAIIIGILVASVALIMLISSILLYLYLKNQDDEKSDNETASEKESDDKKEFTPLVIATVEPTNVVDNEVVFTKSGQCKQNGSYDSYESYIENPCKIYANDELIYTFPSCDYANGEVVGDKRCVGAYGGLGTEGKYYIIQQAEGGSERITLMYPNPETRTLELIGQVNRTITPSCMGESSPGCAKHELFDTVECQEDPYLPSCYKYFDELSEYLQEEITDNYEFKVFLKEYLPDWYESYY